MQILLVTVHGSERDAIEMSDAFTPFAVSHRMTTLAPLFPGEPGDPASVDNYKFIRYCDVRFDHVLLQMLAPAADRVGSPTSPIHLIGFSGGAQFVHRFFYLHPHRVASVSIVAPGRVTLLDDTLDWWAGTRNVTEMFGQGIDVAALRGIPVQIVVGSDDTGTGVASRVERAHALYESYCAQGLLAQLDIVAGARHELSALIPTVTNFIGDQIPPQEGVSHVPLRSE